MLNLIRRMHLIVGLAGVAAFLGTGLYMDRVHGHLRGYDDTVRMLYRSTHIYLLLSASINVMTGLYLRPAESTARRLLQGLGSVALVVGPPILLAAFCVEPYLSDLARPWSRIAIYLTLVGVVFHLLSAVRRWGTPVASVDQDG